MERISPKSFEWKWPPLPVQFPEHGFSNPFHVSRHNHRRWEGKEHPRTILELRMCALSHHIREIPSWWEEVRIAERWREKALEQAENTTDGRKMWKLTPPMVDYVLEELKGYADLRDPETGIEVGPAERIWKSDTLIPSPLREKLLAAVAPLENVPDSEKGWCPDSDGLVLDLVDPSLYPIVTEPTLAESQMYLSYPGFLPSRFQSIPSDFFVDPDGKVTLTSPYINNVHPTRHKDLYSVIPEILQHALPMFERVLSDMIRPLLRMRVVTSVNHGKTDEESADCIWDGDVVRENPSSRKEYEKLLATHSFRIPEARKFYDGDLEVMKDRISLRDRTSQVIVKLANIVLTPEKPRYPGGRWHVEGTTNEAIASSFVYYYDSENVTEGRLSFRRATSGPHTHGQNDAMCTSVLYSMVPRSPLVQGVGGVITKCHRCVAFPNLYQRRVQPFELQDPTKPGHSKILFLFLVDPTWKIRSASDVEPQQRDWLIDYMRGAGENSLFSRLPDEILAMIAEHIDEKMGRLEAEKYREEFAAERTAFVGTNNKENFEVKYRVNQQ